MAYNISLANSRFEGLGLIPDWQFYPAPPPIGTGKFEETVVDLPGACPSMGICGAMGLGQSDFDISPIDTSSYDAFMAENAATTRWIMLGTGLLILHSMLRLPLAVVDGVHGYKRNNEDGASAAGWGALGFMFPLTTTTVALIQGYGKPKKALGGLGLSRRKVEHVVIRRGRGGDYYAIPLDARGKPTASSLRQRSWEYSDEAHDAAQRAHRHATVSFE